MKKDSQPIEDFSELSNAFDFDIEDFDDCFNSGEDIGFDTRFIKPPNFKARPAFWKNAQATAKIIDLDPDCNYFGFIDGSFIFGDLIEALFVDKQIRAYRMDISTLSLSQENIDSLATLLIKGYIKELNLIISDYFYAHERHLLIPYIQKELDFNNRFQLIVAGNHTKIIAAKLNNGIHLVMHGSANLRSSGNIEQISIQDNKEIYDFIIDTNDKIKEKFKTINKSVRRAKVWQAVTGVQEAEV